MSCHDQGKFLEVVSSSLADVYKGHSLHSAFIVHEGLLLPPFHPYICPGDGQRRADCPHFMEGETEALFLVTPESGFGVPAESEEALQIGYGRLV